MSSGYDNLWDALTGKLKKPIPQPTPHIDNPFSDERTNIFFGKRLCGYIVGQTYFSERVPSKHFYVMGQGYPITNDIIKQLKNKRVFYVVIIEYAKKGIIYWASTLEKYTNSVMIQHEPFEQQRCVPLLEMVDVTKQLIKFNL